jgi:hypothetical protein
MTVEFHLSARVIVASLSFSLSLIDLITLISGCFVVWAFCLEIVDAVSYLFPVNVSLIGW